MADTDLSVDRHTSQTRVHLFMTNGHPIKKVDFKQKNQYVSDTSCRQHVI